MAIVDIGRLQPISIPTLRLSNGEAFKGMVKISDSETLIVELDPAQTGRITQITEKMYMLAWEKEGVQRSCPFLVRSHSGRELVGQLVVQERREAPRWHIEVDLRYEVVPAEDVKIVSDQVMAHVSMGGELPSESLQMLKVGDDQIEQIRQEIMSLRELMHDMAGKIEEMSAVIRGEIEMPARRGMMRPVMVMDCSSLGVGFIASQPLNGGDTIRIEMKLRANPAIHIECMGCVVRCAKLARPAGTEGADRYDTGVRFTTIHEADRERLIHYLFKVQRHLLRDRKEARDSMTG